MRFSCDDIKLCKSGVEGFFVINEVPQNITFHLLSFIEEINSIFKPDELEASVNKDGVVLLFKKQGNEDNPFKSNDAANKLGLSKILEGSDKFEFHFENGVNQLILEKMF